MSWLNCYKRLGPMFHYVAVHAGLKSDFTHIIYLNLKTLNIRGKFWFLEAHERIYMGSIQSKSDTQLNP